MKPKIPFKLIASNYCLIYKIYYDYYETLITSTLHILRSTAGFGFILFTYRTYCGEFNRTFHIQIFT